MTLTSSTLEPGTRLGPYEVVAPLGVGGMGEVYRALDPRLEREIAVKVLPEVFGSDPDRLRRFRDEALTASRLQHPNIVHIYDIGDQALEGRASLRFVAMELVEGETLASLLAKGAAAVGASAVNRSPGTRRPGSRPRSRSRASRHQARQSDGQ